MIAFDLLVDARAASADDRRMSTWSDFAAAAPQFAEQVRERLDAHRHKTLATLRRDGAPRISGTETVLKEGELWIGSMWEARKARDLQRDPRYALHSGSEDPPAWPGDAKLAGRAEEITDPVVFERIIGEEKPPGPAHLFRLDLDEVSHVGLNAAGDGIVVTVWTPDGGVRTVDRR